MNKEELRHRLKEARMTLSSEAVASRSAVIVERLMRLISPSKLTAVHCYEPVAERHEVDVSPLFELLLAHHPAPILYTSRKLDGWWQLMSIDGQLVHGQPHYDCIIIPMLGFDPRSLHRLGNGGGYYDRFLSTQQGARKIGVCFELGKINNLPTDPHDVPLDTIVTEQQVYRPSAG